MAAKCLEQPNLRACQIFGSKDRNNFYIREEIGRPVRHHAALTEPNTHIPETSKLV